MTEQIAVIFRFPSVNLADEASNRINGHLRANLQALIDCPIFAQTCRDNGVGRNVQLATAPVKGGAGWLYVYFRGTMEEVQSLLQDVKLSRGAIQSVSAPNPGFVAEVGAAALQLGMQTGSSRPAANKRLIWIILLILIAAAVVVALVR